MGRVWVQQSRAGTRLEDARERAAGFRRRRRRGRPGGPSDPDASGRVPGAGHQRPAASRRHVAVLGVARGTGSLTSLRSTVRSPRHRVGGARMNRRELVFEQPRELFASSPVELDRGSRDQVRLLVTTPAGNRHATFVELPRFLSAGDLLVANESATLAASLEAHGPAGTYTLDLSTRYADGLWLAEPRWDPAHPGPMPIQPGEEAREAAGVRFTSVVLHSGVSSLEIETDSVEQQAVYPEPFQVSRSAAELVNRTREEGHRVVAIGTTVVRALESAWTPDGLRPRQGFTRLFVHPGNPVRSVDGLLTGFHDPVTSHLAMLAALIGLPRVMAAYREAIANGYRWHEFGDSHLILRK